MSQHTYYTGEFAKRASVSIRTLRFYDKVGLLSPSAYTEAGYRLYTEENFIRLQRILALKFLGFSLEEIRLCLRVDPMQLQESLAQQRAMMHEKKEQLEIVIKALERTEALIQKDQYSWEQIIHLIQVMQMTQNSDWAKKYFTEEQLQQMNDLSRSSYTEEDRQKLAERGKNFTEEDQKRVSQQWATVSSELNRLVNEGKDPADLDAQVVAALYQSLIQQFTHRDAGIAKGLNNYWNKVEKMPEGERPISLPYSKEEAKFLEKAVAIYNQKPKS